MPILKNANDGKQLEKIFDGIIYRRYPVKTKVINYKDDLLKILENETNNFLEDGDVILIAESVVSISEGRAFKFSEIKYGKLAKFLSQFVTKTPAGIGLGTPQTMQLAINEIGYLRILFAFFISAITKPFGLKGMFYRIAGEKVRGIDGPTSSTIPPYNEYASLIPKKPKEFVKKAELYFKNKKNLNLEFIIIDANDIGVNILGARNKKEKILGEFLASDNPLGQSDQSTPFLICKQS
ncbi:MAG: coenzyme F420-0:L-glutamate ligase [Candidatus Pacebacteria bacterium]|nr:coenzyme F420-0:L-glutamate ligase [Candidatus Paceibacterota bacterium]